MSQSQQDLEKAKIHEAATKYVMESYDCDYEDAVEIEWMSVADFKAGVQWRDKNPSPAVQGLVEAIKRKANCNCQETIKQGFNHKPCWGCEALAAYEESLK